MFLALILGLWHALVGLTPFVVDIQGSFALAQDNIVIDSGVTM
jgi:hypothetical protein